MLLRYSVCCHVTTCAGRALGETYCTRSESPARISEHAPGIRAHFECRNTLPSGMRAPSVSRVCFGGPRRTQSVCISSTGSVLPKALSAPTAIASVCRLTARLPFPTRAQYRDCSFNAGSRTQQEQERPRLQAGLNGKRIDLPMLCLDVCRRPRRIGHVFLGPTGMHFRGMPLGHDRGLAHFFVGRSAVDAGGFVQSGFRRGSRTFFGPMSGPRASPNVSGSLCCLFQ
jgi:hypothetical protein